MNRLYLVILFSLFVPLSTKAGEAMSFLKSYCYDCHDTDVQKGGIRLDNLSKDLEDPSALKKWVLIHDLVKKGDMPPKKKKKQPDSKARLSFINTMSPVLDSHSENSSPKTT